LAGSVGIFGLACSSCDAGKIIKEKKESVNPLSFYYQMSFISSYQLEKNKSLTFNLLNGYSKESFVVIFAIINPCRQMLLSSTWFFFLLILDIYHCSYFLRTYQRLFMRSFMEEKRISLVRVLLARRKMRRRKKKNG
jgi:hypothetical protein